MSHYKRGLVALGGPVTVLGASWDPAPSVADVLANKAPLHKGQQGQAVSYLQRFLGVSEDGKFGNDTEAAVKQFQAKYTPGDVANGVVGGDLLKLIMTTTPAKSSSAAPGRSSGGGSSTAIYDSGSSDSGVIAYFKSLPTWQLVLGGVGVLAVGYATYRLVTSGVRDRRASALERLAA